MVVCVCNAIKEKDVREAARNGARSARCMFRAAGCRPKCAQCVQFAQDIIANEQQVYQAA
jgi:bacterioferritin-associated ferredoxin